MVELSYFNIIPENLSLSLVDFTVCLFRKTRYYKYIYLFMYEIQIFQEGCAFSVGFFPVLVQIDK